MIDQVNYIDAMCTIRVVNSTDMLRYLAVNELFDRFQLTVKHEGLKVNLIHSTANINDKIFKNGVIEKIVIVDKNNKEFSVPCTEKYICELYKKLVVLEYKYIFEKANSDIDYNTVVYTIDSLTNCTKLRPYMNAVLALDSNDDEELCYKTFMAIRKKYDLVLHNNGIKVDIVDDPENGLTITVIGIGFQYNYDADLTNAYAFYNLAKLLEANKVSNDFVTEFGKFMSEYNKY